MLGTGRSGREKVERGCWVAAGDAAADDQSFGGGCAVTLSYSQHQETRLQF